ncbi:hypothetical protein [Oscillatoria sp. FACHB-1406]|uniref:hypothetical protein n=1 Tax=Oscillatoria sp. FACHB-1406 TaxID=2692846 RepID=UPI0016858622|nr:hypothetical protein [Oscillatoria sp. FACHB-1406]MBD2578388.1 hypothetical protein [Oscillatoria sp. FACHB-1406]
MPIETVPGTSLKYYLIAFDKHGNERNEQDGKKLSEKILAVLAEEPISDVFVISHGWLGDVPAAKNQYNAWIGAMAKQTADLEKIDQARSGFRPLYIGLHWPSKPWGDEELTETTVSFDANEEDPVDRLIDEYADRIADTESSRQALQTILRAAQEDSSPDSLPPEVLSAYEDLNREADLGSEGEAGAPGSDWEGFDPEGIYQTSQEEQEEVSFSIGSDSPLNKVLEPLRVLSYWKMKERARQIGENAGFKLLTTLQENAAETVRFHLIGHSFGCIVVSSTLNGPKGTGVLVRPVDSLCLLQGAVSLWSYCEKIAYERDRPGYFHPIIKQGKVKGPIVVTHSQYDYAVGKMYPLAGKVSLSSVDFAPGSLPKYGGIGSFGIGGDDLGTTEMKMLPRDATYNFQPGKIYNLESSQFICDVEQGGRSSGAHSDIAKPEVAHALWAAACTV